MNQLPKWVIPESFPIDYDMEASTSIEMTARLRGVVNSLIVEHNNLIDRINAILDPLANENDERINAFTIGLRQEFQDFIDIINLKMMSIELDKINANEAILTQNQRIDEAVNYMTENLRETISTISKELLENESITIGFNYNSELEEITLVVKH